MDRIKYGGILKRVYCVRITKLGVFIVHKHFRKNNRSSSEKEFHLTINAASFSISFVHHISEKTI